MKAESYTLKIGPPALRVTDLKNSLRFYQGNLGLQVNRSFEDPDDGLEIFELGFAGTIVGALDPLLILKHDPKAHDLQHNFAGLYHFAILVPNRKSLAHAYSALEKSGVRFDGFALHLVSESLYLHDPESNGIEIYRDRPFGEWNHDSEGHVLMDSLSLDLGGVLSELTDRDIKLSTTFPNGAKIGHMHLRVTNLQKSVNFYQEKLGLHISADWSNMGAVFLAAGSYHHHIGLNVWQSLNGRRHEPGEKGLEEFPISIPDFIPPAMQSGPVETGSESEIYDPDGIRIRITSDSKDLPSNHEVEGRK